MQKKSYTRTGRSCRVTFYLPADVKASRASLCGEFNDWNPDAHVMAKRKDGTFYVSLYLDAGKSYRYRFLLDDTRWENDWEAESYIPNDHGSDDSLITL
ncbi:MAG: glycoside hydrolase [Ignavibacteria bacterium]|nr:MAG: glycoside hydrolase [Ignavibacteria bacterium]